MTRNRHSDEGSITVSGTGRVAVTPDVADLQLGISIVRPTVEGARSEAATTMAAILAAVDAAGVPRRDVRTTTVSVQPRYEYPEKAEGMKRAAETSQAPSRAAIL